VRFFNETVERLVSNIRISIVEGTDAFLHPSLNYSKSSNHLESTDISDYCNFQMTLNYIQFDLYVDNDALESQWVKVELSIPLDLAIVPEENALLLSYDGTHWIPFGYWHYPYRDIAAAYLPNLYFLDGKTMYEITNREWRINVALFPWGLAGESVSSLRDTTQLTINYSETPGRKI